ncbi:MAG: hypothetical protein R2798_13815 [Chitinophagales bacterium]|nr:hypothetical protein [Chitinophagales bacterium]
MKHLILTILTIVLLTNGLLAQEKISVFDETIVERENFEPVIPRPEQEKIANQKLKNLQSKTGKNQMY